jgi:hypothetical protein
MIRFYRPVDLRSRVAMTDFLKTHFRYNTMNSWNHSTSYACNLKIYRLDLESDIVKRLCDLIRLSEFYDHINSLCHDFDIHHDYLWQAAFNGRSDGYLVLHQGALEPSPKRVAVYPGRATDMDEEFLDWEMEQLRERVKLVQEFDQLADDIVQKAIFIARNYEIEDETYTVKKIRQVLVPIETH